MNMNRMTREKLEIRINDAADGLLSESELTTLERELQAWPGLLQDYHDIISLPEFSGIYGSEEEYRLPGEIRKIRELFIEEETFAAATVFWFKRYVLAASLLILAVSSLAGFLSGAVTDSGFEEAVAADELLYPADESVTEEYVSFIYDWADDNEE